MSETNEEKFRRLVDAFNWGEQERLTLEIVTPDFRVTNAPPGAPSDRDGWIATAGAFHAAFPDIHVTITEIVADGDRLAVHESVTGTHTGDGIGLPPTGKTATVEAVHFVTFADGKIIERKSMTDMMSLFVQLGLVTPPGA